MNKLSYSDTILGWKLGRTSCVSGEAMVLPLRALEGEEREDRKLDGSRYAGAGGYCDSCWWSWCSVRWGNVELARGPVGRSPM